MLPMVVASLLTIHRVSVPMAACGIGRALRVGRRLSVWDADVTPTPQMPLYILPHVVVPDKP